MSLATENTSRPSSSRAGRFAVNVASNVGAIGISILVGFWYTPYLVRSLGTEAYGMIGIATSFIVYLSLATVGLNSAVGRFLTIALERGDTEEANKVFNASVFGTLAVVAALFVPIGMLAANVNTFLRIPPEQTDNIRTLFLLAAASFLIGTLAGPFSIATFSRNRFDIRGGISIAETVTRVGVVLALFSFVEPSLQYVGFGLLAAAIVSAGGSLWSWRSLTSELSVSWKAHQWKMFLDISQMSGWVLINQIGAILFLNVDLLIINHTLTPQDGGKYAALLQLSMVMRNLGGSVAAVFAPTIMHLVAKDNSTELVRYAKQSLRLMGFWLALPIALLCGFSKSLLTLWLGTSFAELWPLLIVMVAPLIINLIVLPLFSINVALNQLTLPAYATLGLGLANCLLAVLLAGPCQYGLYGVAVAGAIALSLKNALFTPVYTAHLLKQRSTLFLQDISLPLLGTLALTALLLCADHWSGASTWVILIGRSVAVFTAYSCAIYFAVLSDGERQTIRLILRSHRLASA